MRNMNMADVTANLTGAAGLSCACHVAVLIYRGKTQSRSNVIVITSSLSHMSYRSK